MKEFMKIKEVQDSKTFTARRLRAIERVREKEIRRAEYDPEGFFRPGTASSAASAVRRWLGSKPAPIDSASPSIRASYWRLKTGGFLSESQFARGQQACLVSGQANPDLGLIGPTMRRVLCELGILRQHRCLTPSLIPWQASAKSAGSASSANSLQEQLMKKDAWDRYTVDELRDDVLDFCRKDFEFESSEV